MPSFLCRKDLGESMTKVGLWGNPLYRRCGFLASYCTVRPGHTEALGLDLDALIALLGHGRLTY